MKLTDRDRALLLDIQKYGILPTRLIASRHFPGVALSTVLRRLRVLNERRYIQRITGVENGSHAWCMTEKGAQELNGGPAKTSFPRHIIEHDLTLMKLRMRLEETGIAQAWIPEHVIRKCMAQASSYRNFDRANIPDGLMGFVSRRHNKLAYAIELEMTAKSQSRHRDIFRQYERRDNLQAYWYIVRMRTIGNQIMKAARQGSYRYGCSTPYLMWSELDEVLADPLRATVYGHKFECPVNDLLISRTESGQPPAQALST